VTDTTGTPNAIDFRGPSAEIRFSAFSCRKAAEQVPDRLVVRRISDLNHNDDGAMELIRHLRYRQAVIRAQSRSHWP
jgi:hypothetical protein